MKKLLFSALIMGSSFTMLAQNALDKVMLDQFKSTKDKSDKDIKNEKAALKPATWISRAQAYEDIAAYYLSLDSNAANIAYEAYQKAIELDKAKPSKATKEAQAGLSGTKLYQAMVQQGAGHYQNRNYTKALSTFKMASEVSPKDTVATMYWGVSAQQLKNNDEAVKAYEKHIALGGKDPVTYYVLYTAYKEAKDDKKALAILNEGIAKNPDNNDLKAERTNFFISSGNMDEALKSLKELAAKDPSNATNLVNIAIIHDNAATNASIDIRKENDKLDSGSDISDKVASKESQVQAYKEERDRLAAQLKKNPKAADVKRRLGEAETFLKEQNEVLAKLKAEKAEAEKNAVDKVAVQKRVSELMKVRDTNRASALEYYNKALKADENNYDALYNLGVMTFNEAVELKRPYDLMNPTSAEFKTNGKALEDRFLNKFKEAIPFFEKALTVNKNADEVKDNLRNLYRILKMEDKLKALGE